MMQTVDAPMLVTCVKNIQEMTTRRLLQRHHGKETAPRVQHETTCMNPDIKLSGIQSVIDQANLAKVQRFPKETL